MLHFKSKQRGLALMSVLVFLIFFSFLSLSVLEDLDLTLKASAQYQQRNKLNYAAEIQLRTIENALQTSIPSCTIENTKPINLPKMSLAEWKSQSCAGNFKLFQYYYFLEKLGLNACKQVGEGIANYYRIALLVLNNKKEKIILQSVIAIPSMEKVFCAGTVSKINPGRQSWRRVSK